MSIEQERQQAQDENTATEILAKLATSEDKLTRQCVASNPNTSIEILQKLGSEFPDEITVNPIFDLLLLENPENKFVLLCLARSSTTSEKKLSELANHKDTEILIAVAHNPNVTVSILKSLAIQRNQHIDVLEAIVKNSRTSTNVIDKLYEKHKYYRLSELILENPRTSDLILEEIVISSWSDSNNFYSLILKHPNASQATIELARFRNSDLDTPYYILEKLTNHKDYRIRNLIARYSNTPVKLLDKLGSDNHLGIKEGLAANPNTSVELLDKIGLDNDLWIKIYLAANPNASVELLDKLSSDNNEYVRKTVAANLKVSLATLYKLVEDVHHHVRAASLHAKTYQKR